VRHAKFGRKLARDTNARKALRANLASSLITNGAVITTLAKAKFVRGFVEKLVTDAKKDTLHSRRSLASILTNQALLKLTREIARANIKRIGGYTRIIKLDIRRGDAAQMARLEFIEMGEKEKSVVPKSTKAKNKTPKKLSRKTSAKSVVVSPPAAEAAGNLAQARN